MRANHHTAPNEAAQLASFLDENRPLLDSQLVFSDNAMHQVALRLRRQLENVSTGNVWHAEARIVGISPLEDPRNEDSGNVSKPAVLVDLCRVQRAAGSLAAIAEVVGIKSGLQPSAGNECPGLLVIAAVINGLTQHGSDATVCLRQQLGRVRSFSCSAFHETVHALLHRIAKPRYREVSNVLGLDVLDDGAVGPRGHQRYAELAAEESVEIARRHAL